MVFFTCNNCGEAVKKSSVEKHYSRKCRGNPVRVSCMDCLKDFNDNEYVAHTKCLSEAEKYSGKNFVPKESKAKGAKKQESWIDIIRSILESNNNLKPAVRVGLERLQKYENVPRKKAKFHNYAIKSAYMTEFQANEVWSILEKELEKLKPKPLTETKESQISTPNDVKAFPAEPVSGNSSKAVTEDKAVTENPESSKTKKSKKSQKAGDIIPNENAGVQKEADSKTEVVTQNPNLPKKKSKKLGADIGEAFLNGNGESLKEQDNNTEASTKKGKSDKSEQKSTATTDGKKENDAHAPTNEQKHSQEKDIKKTKKRNATDDASEIAPIVNKKSKNKNKQKIENNQSIQTNNENSTESGKKSKKRKQTDLTGSNVVALRSEEIRANIPKKKQKVSNQSGTTENNVTSNLETKNASDEFLSNQADAKPKKDQKNKKKNAIENKVDPKPKISKGLVPFSWTAVIRGVVDKQAEGIHLDKLKKKVLKKYIEHNDLSPELSEEKQNEFNKKFLKYLNNCTDIKRTDDVLKKC